MLFIPSGCSVPVTAAGLLPRGVGSETGLVGIGAGAGAGDVQATISKEEINRSNIFPVIVFNFHLSLRFTIMDGEKSNPILRIKIMEV